MTPRDLFKQILLADLGSVPRLQKGAPDKTFRIISGSHGIICGGTYIKDILEVVQQEFLLSDQPIVIKILKEDGDWVQYGNWISELTGNAEVLLKAERTICNVLSRLSGIATHTCQQVVRLEKAGYGYVRLLDTRKSLSILRFLTQYALCTGGGYGHRASMDGGIMVKDNDIAVYGGIRQALDVRLKTQRVLTRVEVEVDSLKQLEELLMIDRDEVDMIMLDNMSLEDMTKAVQMIRDCDSRYKIEASGIDRLDIVDVAKTGVGYISSSSFVTKGEGNPLDISMKCIG